MEGRKIFPTRNKTFILSGDYISLCRNGYQDSVSPAGTGNKATLRP